MGKNRPELRRLNDFPSGPPKSEEEPTKDPAGLFRAAWLFYLVLAILAILWLGSSPGGLNLEIFLNKTSWWIDGILGLTAAFSLLGLWNLGRQLIRDMRYLEGFLAEHLGSLDLPTVISLAIISGFAEELFFRGAVQTSLGWLAAALLFGLVHSGPHRAFRWWVLFAFIAGLVFSGLTLYRGNLMAAMVAHMLVNGINLRRLSRPDHHDQNPLE